MNASIPHYLLYSESTTASSLRSGQVGGGTGRWRIVLEAVDGSSKFEAADDEELPAERLELLAVIRGLEAIPQPARVSLLTDSHYVSRGLRFGLSEWRQNGWQWERFGQLSSVANADLWQRLDRTLQIHEVECRSWRVDAPHGGPSNPAFRQSGGRCRTWRTIGERVRHAITGVRSWFSRPRSRATSLCTS